VRRAAWGLGRLARNAGVLGVIGIAAAGAAADAAPPPARFVVTIVVTVHQEWDHTGAPTANGACERTVRSEGLRDVSFRSAAPTVVRVVDGRVLPTFVRNLTGTVKLAGAHHISEQCGDERTQAIADCIMTRRPIRTATVALRSTKAGTLRLSGLRARLNAVSCPREPADVRRAPLGPVPGVLRAPALTKERTKRITLTASVRRRKVYGPVERGTLEQRSQWRITLVRVPA
jgi:hypothetical protein